MPIYTRKGDKERTTIGNTVYKKNEPIVKAVGQVDELNSFLGLAYSHVANRRIKKELIWIMQKLSKLNVELVSIASRPKKSKIKISSSDVKKLESMIDYYESKIKRKTVFLIAVGTKEASFINVARTVARRAERYLVDLNLSFDTFAFINRLSDYLFVLWRFLNRNVKEVPVDYNVE